MCGAGDRASPSLWKPAGASGSDSLSAAAARRAATRWIAYVPLIRQASCCCPKLAQDLYSFPSDCCEARERRRRHFANVQDSRGFLDSLWQISPPSNLIQNARRAVLSQVQRLMGSLEIGKVRPRPLSLRPLTAKCLPKRTEKSAFVMSQGAPKPFSDWPRLHPNTRASVSVGVKVSMLVSGC